jgi:hypothetical protein
MGAIAYLDADKGVSQLVELVDNNELRMRMYGDVLVWWLTREVTDGDFVAWVRRGPRLVTPERLSFCPGNQP